MDGHVGNTYSWHPPSFSRRSPGKSCYFRTKIFLASISKLIFLWHYFHLPMSLNYIVINGFAIAFLDQLKCKLCFQTLGSKKVFFNPTYFHLLIQQIDPSPLEIDYTPEGLSLTIGIYEWCGGKPDGCMGVGGEIWTPIFFLPLAIV